jgi:hypothetical protein
MRKPTTLSIAQPCTESWAAMTPIATGRHCAACQKTVVDFTLKTDAEILALLAQAAGSGTCGRFRAEQLNRPLQLPELTSRWRTWLAAVLTAGSLTSLLTTRASAQAASVSYAGGPAPLVQSDRAPATPTQRLTGEVVIAPPVVTAPSTAEPGKPLLLRGIVRGDDAIGPLPGVTIRIKNTEIGCSTNSDGEFELLIAPEHQSGQMQLSFVGFESQEQSIASFIDNDTGVTQLRPVTFKMKESTMVLGGLMIGYVITPPAPWHPRAFFNWGKYWITRPFRR